MHKFKVGDYVKCICYQSGNSGECVKIGDKGYVSWIAEDTSTERMYVGKHHKSGKETGMYAKAFELIPKWIEATPEILASLKKGDKVKLRNGEKDVVYTTNRSTMPIYLEKNGWYYKNGYYYYHDHTNPHPLDIVKVRNPEWKKNMSKEN